MYTKAIFDKIKPMQTGESLKRALISIPEYDSGIMYESPTVRLQELSKLYRIYIPSEMSMEIYNKLYLALLHSFNKKISSNIIKQHYENYNLLCGKDSNGIIGGADSFTIIGISGIGKSSAIYKSIEIITQNKLIETSHPQSTIIPYLTVQCPFDSSVKGLLLEILRKVDEALYSDYYKQAIKSRATTDILIGSVSQIAINHIGVLIVDEIQNVTNSNNGKALIRALTQLINNSGISICMVGTPECTSLLESAVQLARRSLGLRYSALPYDEYFFEFCTNVFEYQYVKNKAEISDVIIEWLYEHSAGIISFVISLIHDAQELAILNNRELLDLTSLNEAYKQRLAMMHGYIEPKIKRLSQTQALKPVSDFDFKCSKCESVNLSSLANAAKSSNMHIVDMLKKYITVEEIQI